MRQAEGAGTALEASYPASFRHRRSIRRRSGSSDLAEWLPRQPVVLWSGRNGTPFTPYLIRALSTFPKMCMLQHTPLLSPVGRRVEGHHGYSQKAPHNPLAALDVYARLESHAGHRKQRSLAKPSDHRALRYNINSLACSQQQRQQRGKAEVKWMSWVNPHSLEASQPVLPYAMVTHAALPRTSALTSLPWVAGTYAFRAELGEAREATSALGDGDDGMVRGSDTTTDALSPGTLCCQAEAAVPLVALTDDSLQRELQNAIDEWEVTAPPVKGAPQQQRLWNGHYWALVSDTQILEGMSAVAEQSAAAVTVRGWLSSPLYTSHVGRSSSWLLLVQRRWAITPCPLLLQQLDNAAESHSTGSFAPSLMYYERTLPPYDGLTGLPLPVSRPLTAAERESRANRSDGNVNAPASEPWEAPFQKSFKAFANKCWVPEQQLLRSFKAAGAREDGEAMKAADARAALPHSTVISRRHITGFLLDDPPPWWADAMQEASPSSGPSSCHRSVRSALRDRILKRYPLLLPRQTSASSHGQQQRSSHGRREPAEGSADLLYVDVLERCEAGCHWVRYSPPSAPPGSTAPVEAMQLNFLYSIRTVRDWTQLMEGSDHSEPSLPLQRITLVEVTAALHLLHEEWGSEGRADGDDDANSQTTSVAHGPLPWFSSSISPRPGILAVLSPATIAHRCASQWERPLVWSDPEYDALLQQVDSVVQSSVRKAIVAYTAALQDDATDDTEDESECESTSPTQLAPSSRRKTASRPKRRHRKRLVSSSTPISPATNTHPAAAGCSTEEHHHPPSDGSSHLPSILQRSTQLRWMAEWCRQLPFIRASLSRSSDKASSALLLSHIVKLKRMSHKDYIEAAVMDQQPAERSRGKGATLLVSGDECSRSQHTTPFHAYQQLRFTTPDHGDEAMNATSHTAAPAPLPPMIRSTTLGLLTLTVPEHHVYYPSHVIRVAEDD